MSEQGTDPGEQSARFTDAIGRLRAQLARAIVGQEEVIDLLLTAIFADGHVLLEGLPGLGKTLMVKSLARCLSLEFNRIQFTPDLMPADITGTTVINPGAGGDKTFAFEPGPLFTNLLLADEINRAGPKTQSALLQAMQEREVSIFGRHYPLNEPFHVFATQNPVELAGTYPLPEAQLDRFLFKALIPSPTEEQLLGIARRTTAEEPATLEPVIGEAELAAYRGFVRHVPVADPVLAAVTRAVTLTRPDNPASPPLVRRAVRYGASPRGLQALLLAAKVRAATEGRFHVSVDDVRPYWLPALRHRLILESNASIEGITEDQILREIAPLIGRP